MADRGTALGVGRVMPRIPAPQKLKPTRLTNESKGCLLAFGGTRFACALYLVFGSHRRASVLAARVPCGISLATFHSHHLAEIIPHTALAQDVFGLEPSKRQNGIRLLSRCALDDWGPPAMAHGRPDVSSKQLSLGASVRILAGYIAGEISLARY